MDTLSPDTNLALLQASQNQTDNKSRALKSGANMKDASTVDEAAKDFEAMFITEMMKPMFEGLETNGMFGGGKSEEVFRGILLQEYGKMVAETGQIGIADSVKTEMIRLQEEANGTQTRTK